MENSLGSIIRELRKEKRLTQEALADGICSSVS
ncbi:MAG TPA: transcriptional regulator, partial [Treponema sp.]|nr:transcriptional regulator [Treponema sp.]